MISYSMQGGLSCGRGQLGLTNFITLAMPTSILWVDVGVDRPHYVFSANGANNTIRLPAIGDNTTEAEVGHSILIKNIGGVPLIVNDSGGNLILSISVGIVLFLARTIPNTWEVQVMNGSPAAITAFTISTLQVTAASPTSTALSYFAFDASLYSGWATYVVTLWGESFTNRGMTLTVTDGTSTDTLIIPVGAPNGIKLLTLVNVSKVLNRRWTFSLNKSGPGGTSPSIFGIQLNFV